MSLTPTVLASLTPAELKQLHSWTAENFGYLRDRAADHGLTPEQLLAEFPPDHRSEAIVSAALPDLEVSHLIPQSMRPDFANEPGNVVLELCSELGGMNQQRGARVMTQDELMDVQHQFDVYLDARSAELQGSDPLFLGHDNWHSVDVIDSASISLDPEMFNVQMSIATTEAGWQEGLSNMAEHVLHFLGEMGVPVAAVTARGAAALWPFLRSVDWKCFCSDWRYTIKTLNRAMRAWREGGWKEACKALVLGVMVAHVPHLATVVAAIGLTGLGALGVRWLASSSFMQNTSLGPVLHKIGQVLTAIATFLRSVFKLVEHIADVMIEGASKVVKHVATALSEGAQQVLRVCREMATTAVKAAGRAFSSAARVASNLCGWVTGWFCRPTQASMNWD